MTSFVIESFVADGSHDRFADDVSSLRRVAGSSPAKTTRHLGSYLVPGDEMAFHLFDAGSAGDVERLAGAAGIETERIVEAITGDTE